jgi:hypothetical protein
MIEQSRLLRRNKSFACVGCTRLRPKAAFSPGMHKKKRPGQPEAHTRFCIECGCRPLPGPYRYMLRSQWEEDCVSFVRFAECGNIDKGLQYLTAPILFIIP